MKKFTIFTVLLLIEYLRQYRPIFVFSGAKTIQKRSISLKLLVPPYQDTRLKENKKNGLCLCGLMILSAVIPY